MISIGSKGCESTWKYFEGKNKAVAYVLGKVMKYNQEKSLKDYNINYYPQSYVYLD